MTFRLITAKFSGSENLGTLRYLQVAEKEKPETDLFRAIFRNTDSEDSSSSEEEENEEDSEAKPAETGLSLSTSFHGSTHFVTAESLMNINA